MRILMVLLVVMLVDMLTGCSGVGAGCTTDAECIALHGPFDGEEEELNHGNQDTTHP